MSSIIFTIIILIAFGIAAPRYYKIYRNISLGKDVELQGNIFDRWKNVLLVAFGQQKMFKRIVPAMMHLFIYVAFLFTQVELIEIFVDGFFGVHRFFAPVLGGLYTFIINFIEILSVLAFVGTVVFLWRRNKLRLPRFHKSEMTGWPTLDANLILVFEIILLIGIFSMNGADVLLQKIDPAHYPDTGTLAISSIIGNYFILPVINLTEPLWNAVLEMNAGSWENFVHFKLVCLERFGWWIHLFMVLVFLNYLPISKHLHIFLAFPNTYFANLNSRGEMENMPEIMNEVKVMMGLAEDSGEMSDDLPEFGAKDVLDLNWTNIMAAYTCTECGRCTSECPANITGKKLSPRKVMMDIRDRAEEVGEKIASNDKQYRKEGATGRLTKENFDDGKSLFDYISREELHACTTCNACVEACPVLINPLEPILALRRYEILTESAGPGDWLPMFTAIENGGAVWQIADDRDKWANQ